MEIQLLQQTQSADTFAAVEHYKLKDMTQQQKIPLTQTSVKNSSLTKCFWRCGRHDFEKFFVLKKYRLFIYDRLSYSSLHNSPDTDPESHRNTQSVIADEVFSQRRCEKIRLAKCVEILCRRN